MVLEGLSNVRRHTCSTQVTLSLACDNGHLSLRIANTVPAGTVSFEALTGLARTIAVMKIPGAGSRRGGIA